MLFNMHGTYLDKSFQRENLVSIIFVSLQAKDDRLVARNDSY